MKMLDQEQDIFSIRLGMDLTLDPLILCLNKNQSKNIFSITLVSYLKDMMETYCLTSGKAKTLPAPTHPFSQIFLVIVRVSLDPRLRPRNDERTAQPHAHAMPALLVSMRAVYVSAWEAS